MHNGEELKDLIRKKFFPRDPHHAYTSELALFIIALGLLAIGYLVFAAT